MQDQFPDVLHSAGLTPHEVGWLQLHVEPVPRAADGRAVAELWLQAAVDPPGGGRVELVDASTGATVGEAPLPPVNRGAAIRWRIPLQLPETTSSLRFRVDAPVPEGAERIRAPWKLLDTIEIRLPEDDGPEIGLGLAAPLGAAMALGAAVDQAVVPVPSAARAMRRSSGMKVHPARARPRDLAAEVVVAGPEETFSAAIEALWMPGDPLEGELLRQRLHAHRSRGPTCPACGSAVVPGAEFCPRCLGPVATEPSATPSPGTSPAPAASGSSPAEAALCALHAERLSTGTCGRCGSFFCEECASAGDPELCAACEAVTSGPSFVVHQVYRNTAQLHLGALLVLVFWPLATILLWGRMGDSMSMALPFGVLSLMLLAARHPAMMPICVAADAVMVVAGYVADDWAVLIVAFVTLALTAMFWLRLLADDSPPAPAPAKPERLEGPGPPGTQ